MGRAHFPWMSWLGIALCQLFSANTNPAGAQEKKAPLQLMPRLDALGDPLPPGAVMRLGTLRLRHQGSVTAVALSPDGKTVASLSFNDKFLRLWSAATGKEITRIVPPELESWCGNSLAFSPDGTLVAASLSRPYAGSLPVRLFDARTGKVVAVLEDAAGAIAFSSDGNILGSVRGEIVRLWDAKKRVKLREFRVPGRSLEHVTVSRDGRLVAWATHVVSEDSDKQHGVGVHEVATGKKVWTTRGPLAPHNSLTAVAFSPDGKTLAVSGRVEPVAVYDTATGRPRGFLGSDSLSLSYSSDGSLLALCTRDRQERSVVVLWNTVTRKEVRHFVGHGAEVTRAVVSPDGKTLVSGCRDGAVRLWEVATGKVLHSWPGHHHQVYSARFLPDGKQLVSQGSDHTVRLWETVTGKEQRRLTFLPVTGCKRGHDFENGRHTSFPPHLNALSVSPDGRTIAVCDPGQAFYLWDVFTGKDRCLLKSERVFWTAFAPHGKLLISGADSGLIRCWDPLTGELQKTIRTPYLWGLLFAPDGQTLLTGNSVPGGSPSFVLRNWDLNRGMNVRTWGYLPHASSVVAFSASSDGRTVAVGGMEWEAAGDPILLCDTQTEQVRRLKGHREKGHLERTNGIAFSPDGKLLASCGEMDCSVKIWEVSTGLELLRFAGHVAAVNSVAFSPDGRMVVSSSKDTTLLIWDLLGTGREPRALLDDGFRSLWADLGSEEGKVGYEAIRALVLARDEAVQLLAQRAMPVPRHSSRKSASELLEGLNEKRYAIREASRRELLARGWEVAREVRAALSNPPSMNARLLLERLLTDIEQWRPEPEMLRRQRTVQVLEWIGTEKARTVLRTLADGAPWAEQTRDAKAALTRLHGR